MGAGGPVWDSIVYDPALNLIYIGVGNGTPWNRAKVRGDALYLSSIVALKADTGEYVWHYQTTPGDEWDYDSCSPMVLADLEMAGTRRGVLMQAPKNGFFYVLDRATGALLSADPYAITNWAKSVDLTTGRPIIESAARYSETGKPFVAMPGPGGGHSWQPMSFSPATKLVYIPVTEAGFPFIPDKSARPRGLAWNTGIDFNSGSLPQDPKIKAQIKSGLKGHLAAWDPIARKERWRAELGHPWNGGVLSTAGNLVFQGTGMGEFIAYRADTGERLWSAATQAGVLAAPVSYSVDGDEYVAIEVGWGGAFGLAAGELARDAHIGANLPRVLVYKLGGSAVLPALPAAAPPMLDPPPDTASAATVSAGIRHDRAPGNARRQRHGRVQGRDIAAGSGENPRLRDPSRDARQAARRRVTHCAGSLERESQEGGQNTPQHDSPRRPAQARQQNQSHQCNRKVPGIMHGADPHWIVEGGSEQADDDGVDSRQHARRHITRTQAVPERQHPGDKQEPRKEDREQTQGRANHSPCPPFSRSPRNAEIANIGPGTAWAAP